MSNKSIYYNLMICLILIIIALFVYWDVQSYEFIHMDDSQYVFGNAHVQGGLSWENVRWACTTMNEVAIWHPLTWMSLMLDYQLFKLNAGGYHWTNLLLHIISTVLLFLVLTKMTSSVWRSGFVAALFALHPLHVESVAWIAERKDVLSGVFWMLTMYTYLAYVKHSNLWRYLLMLLFFVLGLMAKPMLVTLPFALLLLDYWPLKRFRFELEREQGKKLQVIPMGQGNSVSRLILEKIPLIVLSGIFSAVGFIAQKNASAVASLKGFPILARLSNALVSYVEYISKMIVPVNMAIFYPHPGTWPLWQVLLCLVVLISITFIVIFYIKEYPYLCVGWGWYLGTLVPVIGLVQVGSQAMADRYTYIPLIGLFIMIAWGLFDLTKKWKYAGIIYFALVVIITGIMVAITSVQVHYWENSIKIFEHTLRVTRNNNVIHFNIAKALFVRGKFDEAMIHLKLIIKNHPTNAKALSNIGVILSAQGRNEEAISYYLKSIELDKDNFFSHYNLGEIYMRLGKYNQAIKKFRDAIKYSKGDVPDIYTNLGICLMKGGRIGEAIDAFRKVISLTPYNAEAHNNLGMSLLKAGQGDEAIPHLREAVRLNNKYAQAYYNLYLALNSKGSKNEAIIYFNKAHQLQPELKMQSK